MKQILRLTGEATAAATGTYTLTDPNYFRTGADHFRVPLGCKVKVWGITISGSASTVELEVSHGGGFGIGEAAKAGRWDLPADVGVLTVMYEARPEVVLESRTGNESLRLVWSKLATDGTSSNRVTLLVEVSDED